MLSGKIKKDKMRAKSSTNLNGEVRNEMGFIVNITSVKGSITSVVRKKAQSYRQLIPER